MSAVLFDECFAAGLLAQCYWTFVVDFIFFLAGSLLLLTLTATALSASGRAVRAGSFCGFGKIPLSAAREKNKCQDGKGTDAMKITCKKSGINSKRTQQLYGVALFAAVLFFCSLWTAGCANNTPVAATTETTVSLPVIKADGTDSVLELAPYFTENQQTLAVDELLPGDGLLASMADGSRHGG